MQQQTLSLKEGKALLKSTRKKRNSKREENIQIRVCEYLKLKYPAVVFYCDLASGMRLPIHIAAKNKKMRSSRGIPDLFIAKVIGDNCGLFIELKAESARLKGGGIVKSDHHEEQEGVMSKLRSEGYIAEFACGFDEAIKLIDTYLS